MSQDPELIGPAPGVTFGRLGLDPQQFNAYSYARNSPTVLVDKTGGAAETPFDVTMAGISIAIAIADPSLANIAGAALDVLAVAVPVVPAVGGAAIRGAKAADKAADMVRGAAKGADSKSGVKAATGVDNVHGNSLQSTKPQHRYEIRDTKTGDVKKTGISGQKLNKDGSSPRANRQVNELNRQAGENRFAADVKETNISGRAEGLKVEQKATNELAEQGHSLELQQRPIPQFK